MPSRYVENPGWQIRVLKDPLARAAIKYAAASTLKSINANTPVVTGEYQAYWEETTKVRSSQSADFTASAKIETSDAIWHIIEYGSVNNPPYAPIRRGVEANGLRWAGS